jgi:hypothetical protein
MAEHEMEERREENHMDWLAEAPAVETSVGQRVWHCGRLRPVALAIACLHNPNARLRLHQSAQRAFNQSNEMPDEYLEAVTCLKCLWKFFPMHPMRP